MSEIVVAGLGIVTAMGIGVDKNIHAIRNNLTGISSRPVILDTNLKLPVGEILLSNSELSDMLSTLDKEVSAPLRRVSIGATGVAPVEP